MSAEELKSLRSKLDEINVELLELMTKRAEIVTDIGKVKAKIGTKRFDPVRESQMLEELVQLNKGPFSDDTIRHLFKQIFKASLDLQKIDQQKELLVSRKIKRTDTVIEIKGLTIGGEEKVIIAGPCAVETYEQTRAAAEKLKSLGVRLLRGGAYKPRTSPYDFQGLGEEGLQILRKVADELDMIVVSEIVSPNEMEMAHKYIDMIQIGARNMQNFELLKVAGEANIPIILKRGLAATLEEFLFAAEYVVSHGNSQVILCERGIRTYERATRNTLDISAVPILKNESHLPVLVDVSHSTGRKDIVVPTSKAALAAGADGIMVEHHPNPPVALCDAAQQLNPEEIENLCNQLKPFLR
ncbi:chorismate mutase [Desulfuribacillus stibiiarsenatis]|uniref:Chorismate mutase n=1 Tax=Desulfuribacillus stibiiarsenatis TaxID=1390249 RepID=A0A1E5LA62_9FIRM|nr:bifunctional 3-deoxy-7-phosphoheptulonate synthase/chorismate mutase [Desulfuribacillus stibiiarsenatis]OEH86958.1 chorismate mutase [Desulfuribacillus stibiiarsenatis]